MECGFDFMIHDTERSEKIKSPLRHKGHIRSVSRHENIRHPKKILHNGDGLQQMKYWLLSFKVISAPTPAHRARYLIFQRVPSVPKVSNSRPHAELDAMMKEVDSDGSGD